MVSLKFVTPIAYNVGPGVKPLAVGYPGATPAFVCGNARTVGPNTPATSPFVTKPSATDIDLCTKLNYSTTFTLSSPSLGALV